MNINEIAEISKLMAKYEITEFSVEAEDLKLKMKRQKAEAPAMQMQAPMMAAPAMLPQGVAAAAPVAAVEAPAPIEEGPSIDAPIVGTFYSSPSPDQAAFSKVGDVVTEDSVVCIVEAMKVMNEIKAGMSGTITEILVEDGTPVEYGQPLFRIK